jgi:hypothetical protein
MKRNNTTLHIVARPAAASALWLPAEICQQIVDYAVADLDPLDVATMSTLARVSRHSIHWIADKLENLAALASQVASHVCSRSCRGRRYENAACMLDKLGTINWGSAPNEAYARSLALFFQCHPVLALRLCELQEQPRYYPQMLSLLNYAALFNRHLVLPLARQRRTKEKQERVRLISDEQPGCATRLCNVVCRASDEPGAEVRPVSSFRVKCVQNGADTEEERRKEMLKCVADETDPLQRELLRYYVLAKKGSAQERRAQYFTVTHAHRKLSSPDPKRDCFEDLVVKLEGRYVHVFSEAAAAFRARCFVCTGPEQERARAFHLLRNEKKHTKELRGVLDRAISEKNRDDCSIIMLDVTEPSVDV